MKGQFPAILPLASLDGQNGFKIDGENNDDRSGMAVSTAGDVNGDGHSDLIIGAFSYPENSLKGRSYVVFGGPGIGGSGLLNLSNLTGANGFKLDGENNGDQSGNAVSAAGDINGDGYDDLLIGAYGYLGGNAKGRSYVVFGGLSIGSGGVFSLSNLNGVNGFKLDGENNGDQSSIAVSAAGDINGDGHVDLLIGAYRYLAGSTEGRSYLMFGGLGVHSGAFNLSSLNGTNGLKLDGENSGDLSGTSVSAAGDINGDGHADLLIGARGYPGGGLKGRSYVVFGGSKAVVSGGVLSLSSLNGTNGFKLDGENSSDYSGQSVNAVGDINGDGHTDLIVGAYGYPGGSYKGRSYVVFGDPGIGSGGVFNLSGLTGVNGFKLDGENILDHSGWSVSAGRDINGDGYADLLIGAYGYPKGNNTGRSYVVFGGPTIVGGSGVFNLSSLNGANGFKLDGENNRDISGASVSTAGDVNGDGVVDVLIGAYGHANLTGRSYVVFGDVPPVLVNNSLSLSPGATISLNVNYLAAYDRNHNNSTLVFIPSALTHGYFSTTSAPDVSLVNFTQQQITSGQIQFVHDGTLVAPSYNITVRSMGIAWTGPLAAKINFIGAPQSHFPAIIPLASLNGQNGFKIDGEMVGDNSGNSVSAAGDINGDGYADTLIGAYGYANKAGRSYIVFGAPEIGQGGLFPLSSLNGANGFKLDGEIAGELSGFSVSAAGDMNHDGYADFMIGAPLYSYTNNSNAGRSYILYGGAAVGGSGLLLLANVNGTNGFVFEGVNQDQVGVALRPAGDLNNDGYLDLVFGAYGHVEYNNTFAGWVYVLFGEPNLGENGLISASAFNGLNGFILNGESSGGASETGRWVNGAGDVNGDSYADLIIGAPSYNDSLGHSYVVFGSSRLGSNETLELSMLNGTNGFKIIGEIVGDVSGIVNGPGDINGDGYDDVLIGACYFNNKTGRSYVLFGKSAIGISGEILLTDLNGSNGFKIEGEFPGDNSGTSSNSAGPIGDINADGYPDIPISSWGFQNNTGRSYIIFGGTTVGSNGLLSLTDLDGDAGFKMDGEIEGEMSGFFAVTGVGDINGDGVPDMGIGANNYNNAVGRTYIVFGDAPPTLVQNRLTLQPGDQVLLNSIFLSAYDRNHHNNTIVFVLTDITHGHFELSSQPGVALNNFTQPQLTNNTVLFVHDGSSIAPSYNITIRSAGIAWTGPSAANITFMLPTPTATPIFSTTVSPSPSSSTLTPTMSPSSTITPTTQTVTPSSTTTTSSPSTTVTPSPASTPTPSTVSPSTTTVLVTTSTTSHTVTPRHRLLRR